MDLAVMVLLVVALAFRDWTVSAGCLHGRFLPLSDPDAFAGAVPGTVPKGLLGMGGAIPGMC